MIVTKQQITEKFLTKEELEQISLKKGTIREIIDGDDNMIGDIDKPENTPDAESMAKHTTDYNARIGSQDFKNDFLGRFGFYFYESENSEKPKVFDAISGVVGDDKVNAVMEAIKPHLEEVLDQMGTGQVNEEKVVEDKIKPEKDDKSIKGEKKEETISPEKLKQLDDLFSKMPKNQVDKIIKLLEKYK